MQVMRRQIERDAGRQDEQRARHAVLHQRAAEQHERREPSSHGDRRVTQPFG
jgi:hypothetical protein